MFCPAEAVERHVWGERALAPWSSLVGPDGEVRVGGSNHAELGSGLCYQRVSRMVWIEAAGGTETSLLGRDEPRHLE